MDEKVYEMLREAMRRNPEELPPPDDPPPAAPAGLTININVYGAMDVGTVTAVKLLVKALQASREPAPGADPAHSVLKIVK